MEITLFIQTLNSLQSSLQEAPLSAIEKELLLQKIAALYESVLLANPPTLQLSETLPPPPATKPEDVSELIPMPPSITVTETVIEEKVVLPQPEETIPQQSPSAPPPPINEPEIVVPKTEEMPSTPVKQETIAEKNSTNFLLDIKTETTSLNERFQQQPSGLNEQVLYGDLKKAIDFNRQFVFIQELFHNDSIAYMKAIERLNNMESLDEAISFLNNEIIHKYRWRPEQQSVKLFEKIIRQKFGA